MKLDPNLIRGILLTAEEQCDFYNAWEYKKGSHESIHLDGFSHDKIVYHIRHCELSNLIHEVHYYDGGTSVVVCDLTPVGHEFLSNIRNESIWKTVIQKGAGASLPILLELAKEVALKHFLG